MSVRAKLFYGHNKKSLSKLKENSVDSIITDPPYGLSKAPDPTVMLKAWLNSKDYTHRSKGFMGEQWDSFVPDPLFWREAIRVLKPGGHCIAFFGTRTYDLGVLAMRLAGFEILNQIAWVYGSGFPKATDISKQIDKKLGKKRNKIKVKARSETSGSLTGKGFTDSYIEKAKKRGYHLLDDDNPLSIEAQNWQGWKTGIKPAMEPIVIARKPFKGNYADNILKYGVGAFNIDGCRIKPEDMQEYRRNTNRSKVGGIFKGNNQEKQVTVKANEEGRFPSNFIHDGSEEVISLFPFTKSGSSKSSYVTKESKNTSMSGKNYSRAMKDQDGSEGSAARFFYCAKTSKKDRDEYMVENEKNGASGKASSISEGRATSYKNMHPTVKPEALMRYLCRLVTPPNGIVLDPFMGSGSTGKACMKEGFRFIGMEFLLEYFKVASCRVSANNTIKILKIKS